MAQQNRKGRTLQKQWIKNELKGVAFIAPFLIIFIVFLLWPVVEGVYVSLHKWTIFGKVEFTGLENYIKTFRSEDFYRYLWNSIFYVLISTPIIILLGLGLALLVNAKIKCRTLVRAAYFLPYVLSVSVVSFIWLKIYDSNRGLLNVILETFHMGKVNWLTDEHMAWWSIVITSVWWGVGFVMVLYLSALQDISEVYYEAAGLDGASTLQKFWYITLPSLKNITIVQIFFQVIAGLKLFGQPQMMTKGGPGDTTKTMIMHIYNTGFKKDMFGEAAAMSVLYAVLMLLFVVIENKATEGGEN